CELRRPARRLRRTTPVPPLAFATPLGAGARSVRRSSRQKSARTTSQTQRSVSFEQGARLGSARPRFGPMRLAIEPTSAAPDPLPEELTATSPDRVGPASSRSARVRSRAKQSAEEPALPSQTLRLCLF